LGGENICRGKAQKWGREKGAYLKEAPEEYEERPYGWDNTLGVDKMK